MTTPQPAEKRRVDRSRPFQALPRSVHTVNAQICVYLALEAKPRLQTMEPRCICWVMYQARYSSSHIEPQAWRHLSRPSSHHAYMTRRTKKHSPPNVRLVENPLSSSSSNSPPRTEPGRTRKARKEGETSSTPFPLEYHRSITVCVLSGSSWHGRKPGWLVGRQGGCV